MRNQNLTENQQETKTKSNQSKINQQNSIMKTHLGYKRYT